MTDTGRKVAWDMSPLAPTRQHLHDLMRETLADHANWIYAAVRPQTIPPTWRPGQRIYSDCSDGVRMLCRWAGAPDPAGNHFGPYGNSSWIFTHLHHVTSPDELEVGDIVLFGPGGKDHAAMVLTAGSNPDMWSDGHQGAPNEYPLSYDRRVKTYCRLPIIDPPLTPQEKLRAMTGYWSWVAWRLGEGVTTWKPYGPLNPHVRPNVPKVISPVWWARWRTFIADRHTGDKATTA